jgi:hypothetical protein
MEPTKYSMMAVDGRRWNIPNKKPHTGQRRKSSSCFSTILFVPISWPASQDELIKKAIQPVPEANALADGKVSSSIFFTLFFNRMCETVEGVPVRI